MAEDSATVRIRKTVMPAMFALLCLPLVLADSSGSCPSQCTCSQTTVDCTGKGITTFPASLPSGTTILNMRRNKLKTINQNSLKSLNSLKEIHLDYNEMTEFPSLGALDSLQVLTISHNKISRIPPNTLYRLHSLVNLDLSYNQILWLRNGSFPRETKLEYLNLNHNNITSVGELQRISMPRLKRLRLSYNKISHLSTLGRWGKSGSDQSYGNLEIFELDHNEISTATLFFLQFKAIKKLYLNGNKFQSLAAGALVGLQNLTELYLNDNLLEAITNEWFYQKDKLRYLNVKGNRIRGIDRNAFFWTPNLQHLYLSDNELDSLEVPCFYRLGKLQTLDINGNKIGFVSENVFKSLVSLTTLNLSRNSISLGQSELDYAFQPMIKLKTLDLSNNSIQLIPKNAFRGLWNLLNLNLSANAVVTIQVGAFSELRKLTKISLHTSQLICDCNIKWLRKWITSKSFQRTLTGKCKLPQWLEGKNLFEIDEREIVCAPKIHPTIKPEIIVQPKTTSAANGSNVTLKCVATSSESLPMRMDWYKGSRLIRNKIIKTWPQQPIGENVYRRMTELTLPKVSFVDRGKYRCHVQNHFGTDWSRPANVSIFVYPYFVEKPTDITVRSGETVAIKCSANGVPAPTVRLTKKFNKEQFPAVTENRFWFDKKRFGITNVKIEDTGFYVCHAYSEVGEVNITMVLTVNEKPKFIRPMKSKTVVVGSTAVLECKAKGNPKPKLKWLKDGVDIHKIKDNRFTLNNELLIILSTKTQDKGVYSCQVSNTLGTARQSAKLIVVSDPSQIPKSKNVLPPKLFIGIIIIVVVSVTLLTSLVWVILICLCKGRRNQQPSKRLCTNVDVSQDTPLCDMPSGMPLRRGSLYRSDDDRAHSLQISDSVPTLQQTYSSRGRHSSSTDCIEREDTAAPLLVRDRLRPNHIRTTFGHLYPVHGDPNVIFRDIDIISRIRGDDLAADQNPLIVRGTNFAESTLDRNPGIKIASCSASSEDSSAKELSRNEASSRRELLKNEYEIPVRTLNCRPNCRDYSSQNGKPRERLKEKTPQVISSSPKKERTLCGCPSAAETTEPLSLKKQDSPAQRWTSQDLSQQWMPHNSRTGPCVKKKANRRITNNHSSHVDVKDDYFNDNNASSSGVESCESSASSDASSVSMSNIEVHRAQVSAVI